MQTKRTWGLQALSGLNLPNEDPDPSLGIICLSKSWGKSAWGSEKTERMWDCHLLSNVDLLQHPWEKGQHWDKGTCWLLTPPGAGEGGRNESNKPREGGGKQEVYSLPWKDVKKRVKFLAPLTPISLGNGARSPLRPDWDQRQVDLLAGTWERGCWLDWAGGVRSPPLFRSPNDHIKGLGVAFRAISSRRSIPAHKTAWP